MTRTESSTRAIDVGGPWFDELSVGQVSPRVPGLTSTDGHAALHQAIVGDRLALALDARLSAAVTGSTRPLAQPAVLRVQPLSGHHGAALVHLRCRVSATRGEPAQTVGARDWRPIGVIA